MKKIINHKSSARFIVVFVASLYICSGPGFFCTNENFRLFRGLGNDPVALGIALSDNDAGEVSVNAGDALGSQDGTSNCSCKKQKKCPSLPRAAITTHPGHRFNEEAFQAKSVPCDSHVPHVTDHRFTARGDRPLMELAWCAPFFSSNPLSLTTILLI